MNDLQIITEALVEFRNDRDWEQFHNPKDLAIALNIEAAELLEAFIGKDANAANPAKIKEDLSTLFKLKMDLKSTYFQ